ncbi:MAG TPA: DUF1761 domain-containing protein [Thermoleophilaceae bacterium]
MLPAQSEPGATGEGPPPWKLGVELLRSLTLTIVVAGLASQGGIDEWTGGLLLGLSLWIGFPAVPWTGAMLWENTPSRLAALHGGDWLAKLLLVGLVVTLLQRRATARPRRLRGPLAKW